ncbi:tail fiber protein [Phascolarctobacterium sp.]|uniref:tail fiber protein n=1 Tax=Phascolarctobacterium sp. TaxID=2049039 RepID=UPI002A812C5F|nr:tail fiber protein [Phascolarctobacterium sp.]MDY5044993.1 tail fiber protein [Phascolarctobacterium sp.]
MSLVSSETSMQAQHFAKAKMDYLMFKGYNNLATQAKTVINGTTFKDSVALGTITTDADGVKKRTVTVSVYNGDEASPRATLSHVFYSNDADLYVRNGNSTANSISLHYDSSNDRLYAKVDGNEKNLGGGGGVPIGTIIAWPGSSAPTEGGTWLLCNGQSCSSYPALVAIVGSTVPNLNGRFLEGTTSTPRSFKNAGLPNITATMIGNTHLNNSGPNLTGALYYHSYRAGCYDWNGGDWYFGNSAQLNWIGFNASRCSAIYGASDTVQPASYTVMYYIKAA